MATSPHFHDDELSCPDCGLNNVKPELLEKLERARTIFGFPLFVNSASRCPEHNEAVGGKPDSAHLDGDAADIYCTSDRERFRLIRIFIELGFSRIGVASTFIHVDISDHLPQGVMWTYSE